MFYNVIALCLPRPNGMHFKKFRIIVLISTVLLFPLLFIGIFHGLTAPYCIYVKPTIANKCPSERTSFIPKLDYNYLLLEDKPAISEKLKFEAEPINIAIIIPYRKRENHLAIFVMDMHRFLEAQGISYGFFVINQADDKKFNRGGLLNAGFKEVSKITKSDCFFFHDVDLIPESGNLTYCCSSDTIIHYASAMSNWNWRMPYCGFFGGVVAATRTQFMQANGFANRFWGWGGEDDEFSRRVTASGQTISHLPESEGRFHMLSHMRDAGNEPDPERMTKLEETEEKWRIDGLNTVNYTVISIKQRMLYTDIEVIF